MLHSLQSWGPFSCSVFYYFVYPLVFMLPLTSIPMIVGFFCCALWNTLCQTTGRSSRRAGLHVNEKQVLKWQRNKTCVSNYASDEILVRLMLTPHSIVCFLSSNMRLCVDTANTHTFLMEPAGCEYVDITTAGCRERLYFKQWTIVISVCWLYGVTVVSCCCPGVNSWGTIHSVHGFAVRLSFSQLAVVSLNHRLYKV